MSGNPGRISAPNSFSPPTISCRFFLAAIFMCSVTLGGGILLHPALSQAPGMHVGPHGIGRPPCWQVSFRSALDGSGVYYPTRLKGVCRKFRFWAFRAAMEYCQLLEGIIRKNVPAIEYDRSSQKHTALIRTRWLFSFREAQMKLGMSMDMGPLNEIVVP